MNKISEYELQNFRKAFQIFDKDNSGSISRQEIRQVFKELHIKVSESELQRIIKRFDQNGDNSIQFDQFLLVVAATFDEPQSQQWIHQVFQTIDQDCDGVISKHELSRVVQLFELDIQQKQIIAIMEQGDPLCEGGINYQEFRRIITLSQE